jgi:hypothetical protein
MPPDVGVCAAAAPAAKAATAAMGRRGAKRIRTSWFETKHAPSTEVTSQLYA